MVRKECTSIHSSCIHPGIYPGGTVRKGTFIVIDGPEGSGKTTMVKRLKADFPEFVVGFEPGGTEIANAVRTAIKSPETSANLTPTEKLILLWGARASLLSEVVRPALEEGKTVLLDRFDSSTYAYQVAAEGAFAPEIDSLFWAIREACLLVPELVPDHYLFLDAPPKVSRQRINSRRGVAPDYYDAKGEGFFTGVRIGFKQFFSKAEAPFTVVDASVDDPTVVYKEVFALVESFIPAPAFL